MAHPRNRAERRYNRSRVIVNRIRKWKDISVDDELWCNPGKLSKHDPYDCRKARCLLCHGDKIYERLTNKRRRRSEKLIRYYFGYGKEV